jgi:ribonuclease HII
MIGDPLHLIEGHEHVARLEAAMTTARAAEATTLQDGEASHDRTVLAYAAVVKGKTRAATQRAKRKRHRTLLLEEQAYWAKGLTVAGLDEAGAGPLAGPVYAACVMLNEGQNLELLGVDDSKKLTEIQRAEMAEKIREHAMLWAVAFATVEEIDRINILQAGMLAMRRALDEVSDKLPPCHLLLDARRLPDIDIPQSSLIKGDSISLSIAAASILAKVERDAYMTNAAREYPSYGFEKHKGYSTKEHLAALRKHGVTPLHRRSFEPVHLKLHQLELFESAE